MVILGFGNLVRLSVSVDFLGDLILCGVGIIYFGGGCSD